MQEQQMLALVKEWVRAHSRAADANTLGLDDDTDLLATGWLDSLGFVELLGYVEKTTGRAVDLSDADPSEFTTVRGFSRFALGQPSPEGGR